MLNRFQLRCAMASVGFGLLGIGSAAALADATAPLDPNAFASLGSLSGATSYVFNTAYGSAPTLTENGATVITGVISNGFAVFDFSDINISTGSTITTSGQLQGSAPLAILSQGSVVLDGSVNIGATGRVPGPGGFAGGVNRNNQLGIGGATLPVAVVDSVVRAVVVVADPTSVEALHSVPRPISSVSSAAEPGSAGAVLRIATSGAAAAALSNFRLGDISIGGLGIFNNGGIGGDDTTGFPRAAVAPAAESSSPRPDRSLLFSSLTPPVARVDYPTPVVPQAAGVAGAASCWKRPISPRKALSSISVAGGPTGAAGTPGFAGDPGVFDVTGYVPAVPEPGIISILMSGGIPLLARHRRPEKRR